MRVILIALVIAMGMAVAAAAVNLREKVINPYNERMAAYAAVVDTSGAP